MKRHGAFTLIEMLGVIGIIAMLVTISVPVYNRIMSIARRAPCMANLRSVGSGASQWHLDSGGKEPFPMTGRDLGMINAGTWRASFADGNEEASESAAETAIEDGNKQMSPSASFFLLVRKGYSGTDAFICPADKESEAFDLPQGVSLLTLTDFSSAYNLSYSMSYPWEDRHKGGGSGNVKFPKPSVDFVLFSDMSPVGQVSDSDLKSTRDDGNSLNHNQDGQCVLRGDYQSAAWVKTNRAGINDDNIFTAQPASGQLDANDQPMTGDIYPTVTAGEGGANASPGSSSDSVMIFYDRAKLMP